MKTLLRSQSLSLRRSGFTLIELMVVITIMVILMTMTVYAVNFNRDGERVSSGALLVQSVLSGARDRAIHAKEPRGVRFFLDPVNNRTVSAMVYIDPAEYWSDGVIQLQRWDANNDGRTDTGPSDIDGDGNANEDPTQVRVVAGVGAAWWELKRRGLLFDGLRMRIPKGPNGTWYSINTRLIDVTTAPTTVQRLILQIPYVDPGDTPTAKAQAYDSGGPEDYELELPPRIIPTEPKLLPQDAVLDLDASQVPSAWRPAGTGGLSSGNLQYSQFMDIVFSPRGNVVGSAASAGVIHFYVANREDATALKEEFVLSLAPSGPAAGTMRFAQGGQDLPVNQVRTFNNGIRVTPLVPADEIDSANGASAWCTSLAPAGDPYLTSARVVISVFTQTGGISIHPVNPTDLNLDGLADDPFLFAETGETAQ